MMTLILFFLKVWSILQTINVFGALWVVLSQVSAGRPPKELTISFNLKTIFEWSLYATSIYSWFYAG